MSSEAIPARAPRARAWLVSTRWQAPDIHRRLLLTLSFVWLVDGVLQFQAYMFSPAFAQMLAGTAAGNPHVVAAPITWAVGIIGHHPTVTNGLFASIQLLIGVGIAWRPTTKPALAASVVWSLSVWWFGEGLGGVLNDTANPVTGAPGAVILYALLAVLLWPVDSSRPPAAADGDERPTPFLATRAVGVGPARVLWLLLWASFAYFAIEPAANRASDGLSEVVTGMAQGQPTWLASLDRHVGGALAGNGLAVSIVLAVAFGAVGCAPWLPARRSRPLLGLAALLAALVWVVGEAFGGVFTAQATDLNTGPLLSRRVAPSGPRAAARPRGADERTAA
jgi:hypothetical protein